MFKHFSKIIFILCVLFIHICWATNKETKHEKLANEPQTIEKKKKTMYEVNIENK